MKNRFKCLFLCYAMIFAMALPGFAAQVYIANFSDFPAYPYNTSSYMQGGSYVGCGPTTGAMIMGYFHHVEGMSGSSGLLKNPISGTNEGLETAWALHGSSYMQTGSDGFGSVYRIEPGLEGWAADRGYEVKVMIHASTSYDPNSSDSDWLNAYGAYGDSWTNDADFWVNSGGSWSIDANKFCDFIAPKLSAGIAIFLTIDTNLDGSGDHWVPLVGYDKATSRYAFYDTYSSSVKWADIYYCGQTPRKDNSISFMRSVEYIGPAGGQVKAPTDLVALSGYFGSVPLAWNRPDGVTQLNNRVPKFTETFGEPVEQSSQAEMFADRLFVSVLNSNRYDDSDLNSAEMETTQAMPAGFLGYNVYRASSSGGPFTKIANQISRQYYLDNGAGINTTRYYKVTAVYSEGESTPTSVVSASTQKDGFHITSGWASAAPSINGKISSGEWSSAKISKITYPYASGLVTLYVMNDDKKLYLAVHDEADKDLSNYDQIGFFFDENIDREWPPSGTMDEGIMWFAWDSTASKAFSVWSALSGYWPNNIKRASAVTTPGVVCGISVASGFVEYEVAIDLSSSPLEQKAGGKMGFLLFVFNKKAWEYDGLIPQPAENLYSIGAANSQTWDSAPFAYATMVLAESGPVSEPDIAVTPLSWDYGDVNVGSYKDKVFQIKNEGNATLSVSSIVLDGDISHFSVISGGGTTNLSPGSTHNVTVRFQPGSGGVKNVNAKIYSNDPDENPLVVTLTGRGVTIQPAVLYVTPLTLDFGTALKTLTLNIQNTGGGTLTWSVSEVPDKPWITSVSPASGTNNGTVTVQVDRNQLTGASDTGSLVVASNGGTKTIAVSIAKEQASLPDHWKFTSNTGNYTTIVLPVSANPNIDGIPLQNGDYIGIFSPAGLCCGWKQWQGVNLSLTAWGDDDQTSDVDGLKTGEEIQYRVFRSSEGTEWDMVQVDYSTGTGIYSANGFMVLSRFDVMVQRCMSLHFAAGWNMFSINVTPDDQNIAAVMAPVASELILVKNGSGQTYIPMYGINDIGNMAFDAGYQAYLKSNVTLDVCGRPVPPNTPIDLPAGWSMVSYLPDVPINASVALATITSKLVLAKNNSGQTYIPMYGINDIGALEPGQGYQVYMKSAGTLMYPEGQMAKNTPVDRPELAHFAPKKVTGRNAVLVIPEAIHPRYSDGGKLEVGDEIAAFNSSGICCGAAIWNGANMALTIWADDPNTDMVDGMVPGETIGYRVWRQQAGEEYTVLTETADRYQHDRFWVMNDLIARAVPTELAVAPQAYRLEQNYPNPFNPETYIPYSLPERATVTLAIYDLQGRLIRVLLHGDRPAGRYTAVWDALDANNHHVPSGVYLYQLKAGTYLSTRKMIVLK